MKIFIQINNDPSQRGGAEAAENRNYLAQRMTDEMNEIIRVLQVDREVDYRFQLIV